MSTYGRFWVSPEEKNCTIRSKTEPVDRRFPVMITPGPVGGRNGTAIAQLYFGGLVCDDFLLPASFWRRSHSARPHRTGISSARNKSAVSSGGSIFSRTCERIWTHVWAGVAKDKELERLTKTEDELTKMQADLDETRWDNGLLNDVIDSIGKSSNDDRLKARDRTVLADDVRRLKEFQDQHQHPSR